MDSKNKIRVLIVDDSMLYRQILTKGLMSDTSIEVVATATDPYDARDKILAYHPDVMTCDVEMPKMNGIEFIRRLLPQYPLPVIIVSTISGTVFEAMNSGAVDFVAKPDINSVHHVESFIRTMIQKIKVASIAKVKVNTGIVNEKTYSKPISSSSFTSQSNKIIAIGASTGGTEAIFSILKEFPKDIPGIAIVQHIPPVFSRMFAERMNSFTKLEVKEAKTGDYLDTGKVVIAPGDCHMTVKKVGNRYRIECFEGEKVNGHCPSVDILFESVAKEAGHNSIGILLTGMGYDGAKGLLAMRRKGAKTIGQDESSSIVYGMPKVAYNIGAVEKQVSLNKIPQTIYSVLHSSNFMEE